jgi:hypothetical protein
VDERLRGSIEPGSPDQSLNVLFDIGHPAHVHLFRHAIDELGARGHRTFVASRDKEVTLRLLDAYGIEHTPLSAVGGGTARLAAEWLGRELKLLSVARRFDPDVFVSVLNPPAIHVSRLLNRRSVAFHDTESAEFVERITRPFADVICTPSRFDHDLGTSHRRYDGYQELAYLHPNRFDPDPDLLRAHDVDPEAPYAVLRFVSWGAHHDVGRSGFSRAAKRRLVEALARFGDVYITSESPLPPEFEQYRLPVPPEAIHHLLSFADLYVGDSGTMATEAALLGTPAVRSSTAAGAGDMSNFRELETEYDLLRSIDNEDRTVQVATDLMADPEAGERWRSRLARLLAEKIDVTTYMTTLVERMGRQEPRP